MMMEQLALWTAEEAAKACQGTLTGSRNWGATSISIDSRTLQPGALFIALKDARDGHGFVQHAFAQGAAAALVSRVPEGLPETASLLIVPDTQRALEDLGRARRLATDARIIAVTGSVGKTTTKEALKKLLSEQGMTHASAASLNNHWGTPLTLARMPVDTKFGVIEIGMNHAGEIRSLVPMARPHVAIVTTVAAVHLENFASVEGIADAKAEIFEGLLPGGAAIINADLPYTQRLKAHASRLGARIVTFGESGEADFRLLAAQAHVDFTECLALLHNRRLRFRVGIPGAHMALNAMGTLAAIEAAGADPIKAASAMTSLTPVQGRGVREVIRAAFGSFTLIDESYNANPLSMRAAIALLGRAPRGAGGRRIAVLGDMLELGPTAPQLHAGLSHALQSEGADLVFLAGPLMRHLWDALDSRQRGLYGATVDEIAHSLAGELRPGDVVMVKGSNGSRMIRAVEALRALRVGD